MNKKGRETVSCGRPNRKLRGENENAQKCRATYDDCLIESNRLDVMPRHVQKSAVTTAIEEAISEYLAGQQDMLSIAKEVTTEVVIVDVGEMPLDKTYGLKRKKNDWLYAKACECGCVTATLGRLEFHHRRCKSRRRRDQQQMSA